ncbi:hypothetical protein AAG570_013931, partial [Ranatra chinensis]
VTEELVRKRCEHNDREIGSLEELSLHQEDIEKLEHLQHWCRNLKILLLHSNLISKIENLGKLKYLEYVNFSLNNIEKIENLEGCESLNKLDFTLNFIGELTSVDTLKKNIHLETLYLSGNPCTDYPGYRDYVIATLPQLKQLDGIEILPSDRIKAMQQYEKIREVILQEQRKHAAKRERQKLGSKMKDSEDYENLTREQLQEYWSEVNEYTPETKTETAKVARACRKKDSEQKEDPTAPSKRTIRLFDKQGNPLNVNEAKIPFRIEENDETNSYVLDLSVYKYLDTNLLEVDVQPNYVRVMVKKKAFQLVLQEEVSPDRSIAQRSQTTGHLVVTMPKVMPSYDNNNLGDTNGLYYCK